jgi:lipopolysaccharide/colanic/teichoic acid biosynthesis glycosyltransferase
VCIPVAIAIKLDSPGQVLFVQERVGLKGKPFRLYKFRTMVSNAEQLKRQIRNEASGPIFKSRRDPRITQLGHFLRKTSLDELPQFWNVLWGDMSLVGTRPPTVEEVKHYNDRHWRRLNVKPGLTGEWQVYGRSNVTNFEEVVDLDLRYQSRWSIRYDLVLILRTILVMVRGDGAY